MKGLIKTSFIALLFVIFATASSTVSGQGKRSVPPALTAKTLLVQFTESGFKRGIELKDPEVIMRALREKGFNVSKRTETHREEEGCGAEEVFDVDIYTATKKFKSGDIVLVIEGSDMEIQFPNNVVARNFIDTVKGMGFKQNDSENVYENGGSFYTNPSDCYYRGADVWIKGNVVKIFTRNEC